MKPHFSPSCDRSCVKMADRFASRRYSLKNKLRDRMIKQLLSSVIAKYRDLSVSRRSIICLSLRLQQIIDVLTTDDKSRYFAQPFPDQLLLIDWLPSGSLFAQYRAQGKEHARLNVRNEAVLSSWINTNLVSRSRTGQKYTEALGTRSTRDNQSMRERCFRQSEHAPALLARGQLLSHINAR